MQCAAPGLLVLLFAFRAAAAPGDPDPAFAGFGDNGQKVFGSFSRGMALQPDGKILLIEESPGSIYHVLRLLQDGSLDFSFGSGGRVEVPNSSSLFLTAIAVQPDGKIVVAGTFTPTQDFAVVRVTAAGVPDGTFGSGGLRTIDFGDVDSGEAILVQPDGAIVVGGYSDIDGDFDFSVTRLLSNGVFDLSFSGDGKVTIPFGGDDTLADMALQANGKLVLVGENTGFFDSDWAVARLNFNGTLDAGFNGDGKTTVGFGDFEGASAVALQPDGKIVVVGRGTGSDGGKMARFTSTGALDSSFDGDGQLVNSENSCMDVAVQANGKILTLGTHQSPNGDFKFALQRMNSNGSLDGTFGDGGGVFPDFGGEDIGRKVAILPDGRIFAQGTSNLSSVRNAMVRLWPDGSPDKGGRQGWGFSTDRFPIGSLEYVHAMSTQPDGRLVIAGSVTNLLTAQTDVALSRYLPNGTLDGTFGAAGQLSYDLNNDDVAQSVAIQPDGKIVVAGYTGLYNVDFLVTRFTSQGALDPAFGAGGHVTVDFAGGADYACAVAIAPDGKIVVAGTVTSGGPRFGVARLNSNGAVDETFGTNGKVIFAFPGATGVAAHAMLVQPQDKRIVVGGEANGDFAIVRFEETGFLDTTFGGAGTGWTLTDMGGVDAIHALARDDMFRIYAAGGGGPNADFALAQYQLSGVFDCGRTCGVSWTGGKTFANWGGSETAFAIDVHDDRVVAAGTAGGQLAWVQLPTTSNASLLQSSVALAGPVDCGGGAPGTLQGGVGVRFLFSNKVVIAATENYDGDRNLAMAGFETIPGTTSDAGDVDVVDTSMSARLQSIVPNPLVGQSLIAFDLPHAQVARIAIYDVAGRLVRTLANGDFPAGRNRAIWDATDRQGRHVAAGVYYAWLETGAVRAHRSVVVIR